MRCKTIGAFIFALVLLTPLAVSADTAPRADWTADLGGNREEIFYDAVQTSDGGYVAAGMTKGMSNTDDVYVVKLSSSGDVVWEHNYGGPKIDFAKSIRQTSDGGYIIGGGTRSFDVGIIDYYILKLDSSGNLQWDKHYGSSQTDICESIIQTSDGGYIAAGQSWLNIIDGNVYIIKLDSSGNKKWDKSIGGGLEDGAYDIQQTSDNGYVIAGYTRSNGDGSYDVYVIKTDSNGNVKWTSNFGGNNDDQAYSIVQQRDGYVVTGHSKSKNVLANSDVYVIKLDLEGKKVWEKFFGVSDTIEESQSIQNTRDGGYIIVGKTNQYTYGANDVYLLKLDSDGNEQWSQVFGGENDDYGYSVAQTSDGGFILAGQTKSFGTGGNAYIIKTEVPSSSRNTGNGGLRDIPEYGSSAIGVLFSLMVLLTAGLVMRNRS
ncbi:MAG: hypothetical protein SCH39_07450 [Methanosarcinales archaeon]|nr:hypothetical protein [Methanosarcinales archaeon]